MLKAVKNKYTCSLITLFIVIILFSIPSLFVLHSLSKQGFEQYTAVKNFVSQPSMFTCTTHDTGFCSMYFLVSTDDRALIEDFLKNTLLTFAQHIASGFLTFLSTLPSKVLDFGVMIFLMFFLFADGKNLFNTVVNLFPMKIEHEKYLLTSLKETTGAIVFGQVFIALLQGVLATAGFWLIGVKHAILLGAIIAFLGVIPFVGPTMVWVPLTISYVVTGVQTGESMVIIKAIIIAAYGGIVLSAVETFLKPKIIGDRAKLHPALVFLGIIGGLSLFGFIGFFLGPIILGVLASLIKIYEKEKIMQLRR